MYFSFTARWILHGTGLQRLHAATAAVQVTRACKHSAPCQERNSITNKPSLFNGQDGNWKAGLSPGIPAVFWYGNYLFFQQVFGVQLLQ